MRTFVLSNTCFRGVQPALQQGGFFCVPAKGALTYKRRPAFTELGLRPCNTRESGVLDSGIVRGRFFLHLTVQHTHHVHHRKAPSAPLRTADYPCPLSQTRRKDGRRTPSAVPSVLPGSRKVGPCRGQNLPRIVTRVTPLFFSYSVTYGELFTVNFPVLCQRNSK